MSLPSDAGRARAKAETRFPQTSWELLTQAAAGDEQAAPALNEFSERYYAAVRAYIAAIVRDPAEYEDTTQRFFLTVVLSRGLLAHADSKRGRFRTYLKQAIRHFLVDELRKRGRKKARGAEPDLRPDALPGGWDRLLDGASPAPDLAFQRAWTKSLVNIALVRVNRICEEKGQNSHFRLFIGRFLSTPEKGWQELGAAFGLDEKTARSRAGTVVRHFRRILRELLAAELESEADVDDEIRALIALH